MSGSELIHASPQTRISALLDRIRLAHNRAQRAALMETLTHPNGPCVLGFVNQHAVNLAWDRAAFADDLLAADILLRDGVGVKAALSALGRDPGLNLNGTDLIPELLGAYRGRKVAVFGSRQPWLDAACAQMEQRFGLRIALRADGFQPAPTYRAAIETTPVDLVLLAMGMPKQEQVARDLRQLPPARLIICGGAIVDFLAGRVARAPKWMQRAGLEWTFRLGQEPARLWGRYGPGGVAFAARILALKRQPKTRK